MRPVIQVVDVILVRPVIQVVVVILVRPLIQVVVVIFSETSNTGGCCYFQ